VERGGAEAVKRKFGERGGLEAAPPFPMLLCAEFVASVFALHGREREKRGKLDDR
jgi:hypothetical protein